MAQDGPKTAQRGRKRAPPATGKAKTGIMIGLGLSWAFVRLPFVLSWAVLRLSWSCLWLYWLCLGLSGQLLGGSWAPLGRLLGGSGWLLGGSWAVLGRSWMALGGSWAALSVSWATFGGKSRGEKKTMRNAFSTTSVSQRILQVFSTNFRLSWRLWAALGRLWAVLGRLLGASGSSWAALGRS